MVDDAEETPKDSGKRGYHRKNVIVNSPHQREYEELMVDGWNSFALERYAMFRYGEDIPASTFRDYKSRKKIQAKVKPGRMKEIKDADAVVDILGQRAALVRLQMERIEGEMKREEEEKHLRAGLRQEIKLADELIESMKADMQDVGLMPKLGEILNVRGGAPTTAETGLPKAATLAEALGAPTGDEVAMARFIHLATKNGQTVPPAETG